MPRGRRNKTPKWAREESEFWILEALKRKPEGARFGELLALLKFRISRQTLSTRLRSLFQEKKIHHDYLTKQYTLTEKGKVELEKEGIIAEIRAQQNVGRFSIRDAITGYFLKAGELVELEEERTGMMWVFKVFAYIYLYFECLNAALPEETQNKLWLSIEKGQELPDEVQKLLPKDKIMFIFSLDPRKFTESLKEIAEKTAKEPITEEPEFYIMTKVKKNHRRIN